MTRDHCKSCGAEILWVKVQKSNKSMPCDARKITIYGDDGSSFTGRPSHFSTCPQAQEWRGAGR